MADYSVSSLLFCVLLPLFFFFFFFFKSVLFRRNTCSNLPKSYPILGSFLEIAKNRERHVQWTSDIVTSTPGLTFTLNGPMRQRGVITANPDNVQHILKSNFYIYDKGDNVKYTLRDLLGDGIFNSDGDVWKFQRQLSSHEFNTKSLRKFIEQVVDAELSDRLIPILRDAAANKTVLDFQDILQRFAFDNVCKIAFGYDPEYLSPELPQEKFAMAFEKAVKLSTERFNSFVPFFWKIKRALNVGSEKELKIAVAQVQDFAREIIRIKIRQLEERSHIDEDLLSRFLSSGHWNEDFAVDIIISFILAGRDTTSAALTWFFWLLSSHPEVENEILKEINERVSENAAYNEVKDMVYTHASICESMRLYPPVPMDTKTANSDDVLPDGTVVNKGMGMTYHPWAMGRVEKVWGADWAKFRPERWMQEEDANAGKWSFVNRDSYTYPVFQAGPRICLGKEMAFLQMKSLIAGILREFRVVPVAEEGTEPVFLTFLTGKMKGGFLVRIEARTAEEN